jgi:Flp pilus assembly protein TadD
LKEGLADIQHALSLGRENAYSYRNLGIYHLKTGHVQEARQQFIKAMEMDTTIEMIDALLMQTV